MLEGLEQLRTEASKYVDAPVWSLPDAELVGCLDALHRLEQTVAAIRSRMVGEIDGRGLAADRGFRGTAGWLRERLLVDLPAAERMVELAAALGRWPAVGRAVGGGDIGVRHAEVIAESLDALPGDVDAAVVAAAEARLLEDAGRFEPGRLRRLGARILDNVAPEAAEQAERAALARAEKRAWRRRGLTLSVPVDGSVRVSGWLTVEDAALVNAAFDPLCVPRPGDDRTPAQRRADALVDICQLALRTGALPDNGGEAAHLMVTVPFSALTAPATAPPAGGSPAGARPAGGAPAGAPPAGGAPAGARPAGGAPAGGVPAPGSAAPGPAAGGVAAGGGQPPAGPAARAVLDSGEHIGPEAARRLACDAQILPVVLGGAGQPLDIGRARRLFTGPIRRALTVRDQGCAFPDCDRPARWCDAHHIRSWLDGGDTSITNGVLLCRRHHRIIHAGEWTVRIGTDQLPEFLPPQHLDPTRQPRRNRYHRRT